MSYANRHKSVWPKAQYRQWEFFEQSLLLKAQRGEADMKRLHAIDELLAAGASCLGNIATPAPAVYPKPGAVDVSRLDQLLSNFSARGDTRSRPASNRGRDATAPGAQEDAPPAKRLKTTGPARESPPVAAGNTRAEERTRGAVPGGSPRATQTGHSVLPSAILQEKQANVDKALGQALSAQHSRPARNTPPLPAPLRRVSPPRHQAQQPAREPARPPPHTGTSQALAPAQHLTQTPTRPARPLEPQTAQQPRPAPPERPKVVAAPTKAAAPGTAPASARSAQPASVQPARARPVNVVPGSVVPDIAKSAVAKPANEPPVREPPAKEPPAKEPPVQEPPAIAQSTTAQPANIQPASAPPANNPPAATQPPSDPHANGQPVGTSVCAGAGDAEHAALVEHVGGTMDSLAGLLAIMHMLVRGGVEPPSGFCSALDEVMDKATACVGSTPDRDAP